MNLRDLLSSDIARPAAAVLAVRVLATIVGFALAVTIARMLGAEESGLFYLGMSVAAIGSIIGKLGMDGAVLRFVSVGKDTDNWTQVAGVYRQGVLTAAGFSLLLAIGVAVSASFLAETVFANADMERIIRIVAWLIPLQAIVQIHVQALNAIGRPVGATVTQTVMPPLLATGLILAAGIDTGSSALAIMAGVWLGSLMTAAVLWFRGVDPSAHSVGQFKLATLWRTGLPLLVVSSMFLIIQWTDTLMLGVLAEAADVGVYYPAWRIATMVSLILVGINAVAPPRFAALHDRGETGELETLMRETSGLATLVAAPVLVIVLVGAPWILEIFGAEFPRAAGALRILAVGEFVNAAVGPVGFLAVMTGHERVLQNIMIGTAVSNIALNAMLIPAFGIGGAATATAVSLVLSNLTIAVWVRRRLRIQPLGFLPPVQ